MSDEQQQDDSPLLIGEPLEADEMDEQLSITQEDIDSAIDWWDIVATDLFVGILGI